MAEFTEVMKQAKRMCDAVRGCDNCPLDNKRDGCPLAMFASKISLESLGDAERIVMDWAAKHPEPRYPNWIDWLYQMGVYRDEKRNGNVHTCCLTENAYLPIPADIAEKLGIKPMGGNEQ